MKNILLILLFCTSAALAQPCQNIVSVQQFNQHYAQVSHTQGDKYKMNLMMEFIRNRCLTSEQVFQMASLLNKEGERLIYSKEALRNVVDPQNSFRVLDAFKTYSGAFSLYDFLKGVPVIAPPPPPPVPPTPQQPLPVCMVTPYEMEQVKQSISKESFANTKSTLSKQILAAKKCFSVMQIKEIVDLQSFENDKLDVAKFAYDYCVEKENYYKVNDCFSFSTSKEELMKYVQNRK